MEIIRTNKPLATLVAGSIFFAFALATFVFSLPTRSAAAEEVHTRAVRPATSPTVEVHIANNGLILLRGAQIVDINDEAITVHMMWQGADTFWLIHTNASVYETRSFGTKFTTRDGSASSLSSLEVGDFVTVSGTLKSWSEKPTLLANSVRSLKRTS